MAFTLPGISGKPIAARNYTSRMRRMPRLIAWYSMVQRAQLLDPALFIPRAGVGAMTLSGTARYQSEQGELVAHFPSGTSDHWLTPNMQMPTTRTISVVCAFNSAEGFTEPLGLVFSTGDRLWIKPTHGGNSGIEYLSGAGGATGLNIAGAATTNNAPHYVIVSFNTATGEVHYQVDGGATLVGSLPAMVEGIQAAVSVGMLVGVGRVPQPFVGRIMEAAWFRGNLLTDTSNDNLDNVVEYMAAAWGIV